MKEEDTMQSVDVIKSKYTMGADIVNTVLKELVNAARPGVSVYSLCLMGDNRMMELLNGTFKTDRFIKKGISFPTCVSIDNCICHFSPVNDEPKVTLADSQVVKFDLGVHIDGYISGGCHTIVIGATKENPVTGKKADIITAAYNAMELVLRMLKPNKEYTNFDVAKKISELCEIYDVTPVQNVVSHMVKRFQMAGDKQIVQNYNDVHIPEDMRVSIEKCTFENYEVYAIDVIVSTGKGDSKELNTKTTIYKWNDVLVAMSKDFSEKKFCGMPFSLRHVDDEEHMDIAECAKHRLVDSYPVMYEDEGEFVAAFRTTAIIIPNGVSKLTGLPLDTSVLDCKVKITNSELSSLLQESLKPKKKKKPTTFTEEPMKTEEETGDKTEK